MKKIMQFILEDESPTLIKEIKTVIYNYLTFKVKI